MRKTDRTRALNFRVHVMFGVAEFRPGRRGPFGLAKGPKTIDAPSGLILEGTDASLRRAGQLAPLKQGPPADKSVPPLGQPAGVGPCDPEPFSDSHERVGSIYSV